MNGIMLGGELELVKMAKNHEIRVRLTKEEHERIKSKALKFNMSLSGYIKLLALNSTIKVSFVD